MPKRPRREDREYKQDQQAGRVLGSLTDRMQGIDAMEPILTAQDRDLCLGLALKSAHRRCGSR